MRGRGVMIGLCGGVSACLLACSLYPVMAYGSD